MLPIERHKWAVLQFSGGKDSLACLYLLKPYWHKLKVFWVNTGAAYPETISQMQDVSKLVSFTEIKSDQPAHIERYGPAADVVPVRASPYGRWVMSSSDSPIQSPIDCCSQNIWGPMTSAVKASGATLVIRGQRNTDEDKSPARSGMVHDGVEYWFPVEDWSELKILRFLQSEEVALPDHYKYVNSSLDCWSCTAYRSHVVGRMKYMKEFHPVLHGRCKELLERVERGVKHELSFIEEALR